MLYYYGNIGGWNKIHAAPIIDNDTSTLEPGDILVLSNSRSLPIPEWNRLLGIGVFVFGIDHRSIFLEDNKFFAKNWMADNGFNVPTTLIQPCSAAEMMSLLPTLGQDCYIKSNDKATKWTAKYINGLTNWDSRFANSGSWYAEEILNLQDEIEVTYQFIDGTWKILFATHGWDCTIKPINDGEQWGKYTWTGGELSYQATLALPDIAAFANSVGTLIQPLVSGRGFASVQFLRGPDNQLYFMEYCMRFSQGYNLSGAFGNNSNLAANRLVAVLTSIAKGIDPNLTIPPNYTLQLGFDGYGRL